MLMNLLGPGSGDFIPKWLKWDTDLKHFAQQAFTWRLNKMNLDLNHSNASNKNQTSHDMKRYISPKTMKNPWPLVRPSETMRGDALRDAPFSYIKQAGWAVTGDVLSWFCDNTKTWMFWFLPIAMVKLFFLRIALHKRGGESVSFLFRSGSKFFLTSPKTTNLQFQLHSSKNQMILRVVFQGLHHGTCQLEIRSAGDSTGAPELLTGWTCENCWCLSKTVNLHSQKPVALVVV